MTASGLIFFGGLFSGASCPGLIEADAQLAGRAHDLLFSGASCPGLIEASVTAR